MKRIIHSPKLSETDIDSRLRKYFTDHQIMQRSDFQDITGMVRSTAMIHIRRSARRQVAEHRHTQSADIRTGAGFTEAADYQPVNNGIATGGYAESG